MHVHMLQHVGEQRRMCETLKSGSKIVPKMPPRATGLTAEGMPCTEEDARRLHRRVGKVVDAARSEAEAANCDALTRAATRIQAHYRGHVVRKAMKHYRIGGQLSEVRSPPACHAGSHCVPPPLLVSLQRVYYSAAHGAAFKPLCISALQPGALRQKYSRFLKTICWVSDRTIPFGL